MMNSEASAPPALELIPDREAERIANIVGLTEERLRARYKGKPRIRRGVHPKDHGCVKATFTVLDSLPEDFRVGVFSRPGQRFDAFVRFSNAEVNPDKADTTVEKAKPPATADQITHGSRGMAVKLVGVRGTPLIATNLMTTHGPVNQDFLMINQPVFAFANVEDYEALSQALLANDDPRGFFARLPKQGTKEEDYTDVEKRAVETRNIIGRIQSLTSPPAFQAPPLSPLDNRYFSAAPFLFGEGRAMKFSANPVSPDEAGVTEFNDAGYLRTGLRKRLAGAGGQNIEFEFQVQVRSAAELAGKLATEIEDMCVNWPEKDHPFETVAMISIPAQDIDDPKQVELCEDLVFSPWHGLREHRPLGGINRLRRAVYEASVQLRHGSGALASAG
jgi:hypothetical protein